MIPIIFFLFTQDVYEVEGVVVTATRYPIMLKDLALATTVIEKEEIQSLRPRDLGELLQNCAGIDIKDYGTGSLATISLRGIPASGVLILIDGQPLNSIQTGIGDLSVIDVNSIERIEIVKGPTSSLYGANGLGGAVNIITRKERGENYTVARVNQEQGIGKKPYYSNYYLQFSIPVSRHFFYKMDCSKNDTRGERTNSDLNSFSLYPALDYRTERIDINSRLNFLMRDYGLPGPMPLVDSLHFPPYFGDSTASSKFDYEADRVGLASFDLNYRLTGNIQIYTKLFTNLQRIKYHSRYFSFGEITEDYNYSQTTTGMNTALFFHITCGNFLLGLDYRHDTLSAKKNALPPADTEWQAEARNFGYWSSNNFYLNKFLNLNLSLRYDRNSSYGDFLSPQLGLVIQLSSRTWLKLSGGRAFRAPGFNDLYWPVYGNPDLKPEDGKSGEIRLETSPRYYLFTAISIFARRIDNRIAWLPGEDGLWKPQNLNWTAIDGGEFEVRTKIGETMKFSLDGTYLFARQKNQELVYYDIWTSEMRFEEHQRPAAFIPQLGISLKLDIFFKKDLSLNITNSYTSPRKNYYENWSKLPEITMDTKTLKEFYLLNINLQKSLGRHTTFVFGSKNLLNAEYATQFGNSISDLDYPMPKRTVFLQVEWRD